MESNNKQWWYSFNNEIKGPVNEDEITRLIDSEIINESTLVWQEGMADWLIITNTELQILLNAFNNEPPPFEHLINKDSTKIIIEDTTNENNNKIDDEIKTENYDNLLKSLKDDELLIKEISTNDFYVLSNDEWENIEKTNKNKNDFEIVYSKPLKNNDTETPTNINEDENINKKEKKSSRKYYYILISVLFIISLSFSLWLFKVFETKSQIKEEKKVYIGIPERPNPPRLVNDFSGVLNESEIYLLERKLDGFEKKTSNQIAIIIVNDLNGLESFLYAQKIGEYWGVGQKGKNNGIVILVKPTGGKKEVYISIGYGLESVISDQTTKTIVERDIIPSFRTNNFYEGLDKATTNLMIFAKIKFNSR